MTRATANEVLRLLKGYYPRQYPETMTPEKAKFIVDDLMECFGKFRDADVIEAYKTWHKESPNAPSISEMLQRVRSIDAKHEYDTLPEEPRGPKKIHARAVEEWMKDLRAGTLRGNSEWYFNQYPEVTEV